MVLKTSLPRQMHIVTRFTGLSGSGLSLNLLQHMLMGTLSFSYESPQAIELLITMLDIMIEVIRLKAKRLSR
uniref:Uncharacterized protein n=1 Tax=Cucumis melo TaxID=3656 RepID=A0A9I9EKF3_CUCME